MFKSKKAPANKVQKDKKISDNQAINDYLKEARGFEKSRIEFVEKSKTFWQYVALGRLPLLSLTAWQSWD